MRPSTNLLRIIIPGFTLRNLLHRDAIRTILKEDRDKPATSSYTSRENPVPRRKP